jgi:hypothetical protein
MNPAPRYVVDLVERDFTAGTAKASRLQRRFKTRAGAEKAAARLSWICKPDGVHATQEATATVSEVTREG